MASMTAVLDACVLYRERTRDLLMHVAQGGGFRARWTDAIHDEWTRNLKANRPDVDPARIDRTRNLMNESIRECLVAGYEPLIPSIDLPDPGDRHVVAAAIQARADIIVTYNLKDFPTEALRPHAIEAEHPDKFLVEIAGENDLVVMEALQAMQRALKKPPMTIWEIIESLEREDMPRLAEWIRSQVRKYSS